MAEIKVFTSQVKEILIPIIYESRNLDGIVHKSFNYLLSAQ